MSIINHSSQSRYRTAGLGVALLATLLGACGSDSETDSPSGSVDEMTSGSATGSLGGTSGDAGGDAGGGGSDTGGGDGAGAPGVDITDQALLEDSFPVVIYEFEGAQFIGTGWLALADGSLTNDFDGVRTLGPAQSLATHPEQWGAWRRGPGEFEIERRLGTTNEFVVLAAEYPVADVLPNGCYANEATVAISAENGSTEDRPAQLVTDTLCFNDAGYYSLDEASGLSTDPGSEDGTGSDGTYLIDGFELLLTDNDGARWEASFGNFSDADSLDQIITIDAVVLQNPS